MDSGELCPPRTPIAADVAGTSELRELPEGPLTQSRRYGPLLQGAMTLPEWIVRDGRICEDLLPPPRILKSWDILVNVGKRTIQMLSCVCVLCYS